MTKKPIKDLPEKNSAKESELKNEDLAKVTGGVYVIGGMAMRNPPLFIE